MASAFDPGAVLTQLVDGYLKLPLMQKIIYPVLIGACVFGIVVISRWANSPDYAVLFSDLQPVDSAAVIERLKSQKIKYEVQAGGSTIAVSPPDIVHELRINLAGEGVPKGGTVGYEIFDSSNLGTTTFVEKLKLVRAMQGELERTISSIDAVSSVRVHITQPEKSVFAKEGAEPTASVMIKLRPGGELDKKQIRGITNLVAGSVEGLKAENVTIVDTYGNLLTPKEDETGEGFGIEATQLQYQKEIEKGYVQRIEQLLQKVLGPGKAIARVTAELDFSSNEREEESYDPGGQVIRSERSVLEGTGQSQRGGVPGVVSNLTNDPKLLAPQGSGAETAARNENVKNYEVSRAVIKSSSPRGKLIRLSAAVLVDGNYEEKPAEGAADAKEKAPPLKTFVPLSAEVLNQIESLAKSAIGFDSARGDKVTVENIPFFEPDGTLDQELAKKVNNDFVLSLISKSVPILIAILFFMVMVRPLVKHLVTPTEAELDLERLLPTGITELEKELEAERSKANIPTFEPAVDLEQLEELMSENSRIVKENPQQAALLIRYWLNDGRI